MDKLTYQYEYDSNSKLLHNKLGWVDDTALSGSYTTDIDDQGANNYDYDAIGNLVSDVQEGIAKIEWTVSGKVKKVSRVGTSTAPDLEFVYDALGNRIEKIIKPAGSLSNPNAWTTTFYVRDAQGNVLATYEKGYTTATTFTLQEKHLYGSGRLGVADGGNADMLVSQPLTSKYARTLGLKTYELSNHLGNVLVTVNDRKLGVDADNVTDVQGRKHVENYLADVLTYSDYYAFGMAMPGRSGSAGNYRYGFNGKEKDTEWDGGGSMYDYGFRIYNPRLGKFLSVDPLTAFYSYLTPYQFAENTPVWAIDLDGLEAYYTNDGTQIPAEEAFSNPQESYYCVESDGSGAESYYEGSWIQLYQFDENVVVTETAEEKRWKEYYAPYYREAEINYRNSISDGWWRALGGQYPSSIYKEAEEKARRHYEQQRSQSEIWFDPITGVQSISPGKGALQRPALDPIDLLAGGLSALASAGTRNAVGLADDAVGLIDDAAKGGVDDVAKEVSNLSRSSLTPTHYITKSKTQMRALLDDINANGIKESIKYVEHNGVKYIVDGHHRFYAAQRLGIQNVPVQQVQLPYGGYKNLMDLMPEGGKQPGFWKYMK